MVQKLSSLNRERQAAALQMPRVEQRFNFLRVIAYVLFIVAGVVAVGGVGLALLVATMPQITGYNVIGDEVKLTTGPPNTGLAFGIGAGAIIAGLLLVAFAQLIQVQLAREESARITNMLLLRLFRSRE